MGPSPKSSSNREAPSNTGVPIEPGRVETFPWVHEYLEQWAKWHEGSGTIGGGTMRGVYSERIERSTAGDFNGTAHESLMLDVEAAVLALREAAPHLYRVIHCFYRRDMGRHASALACGMSLRGFDGRLNLARYHVARWFRSRG